jgi:LysM repeat protein
MQSSSSAEEPARWRRVADGSWLAPATPRRRSTMLVWFAAMATSVAALLAALYIVDAWPAAALPPALPADASQTATATATPAATLAVVVRPPEPTVTPTLEPSPTPLPEPTATTPPPTPEPPTATPGPIVHVVAQGENLYRIAARYGVSVDDVRRANPIADPDHIEPGQRLVIPRS